MARKLYVANCGENSISVISVAAQKEVTRIPLLPPCCGPRRLKVSGSAIYHVDTFSATVGRISAVRPHLQSYAFTGACPTDLLLDQSSAYVACGESNSLWQFHRRSLTPLECVSTETFPIGMSCKDDSLCICSLLSSRLDLFDKGLTRLESLCAPSVPLCVGSYESAWLVSGIDTAGRGLFSCTAHGRTVSMTCPGARMAVYEKNAVIAHVWDDSVSLIDLETFSLIRTAPCGRMPDEVCIDGAQGLVFVSCMLDDTVNVLDLELNVLAVIPVGKEPRGLALA